MTEPSINFNQFTSMVNTKLNKLNMSEAKQSYIQSQLGSVFTQGDKNKDNQLTKSELNSVLGMLNQVVSLAQEIDSDSQTPKQKQQINDPRFQGLENYQFEAHIAKDGVGAITVNGEKMLIMSDDKGGYELGRFDNKTQHWNYTNYSSKDELNKALTDKNNNFGTYSGINDLNDVFIP